MEDREIIKALEICYQSGRDCEDCPYENIGNCYTNLKIDAHDLIKRQQERIERLKDNLDAVLKERATLDVDMVIEKLKEKSYGFEGLEYIDLDTAMAIVQGGGKDDR